MHVRSKWTARDFLVMILDDDIGSQIQFNNMKLSN